MSGAWLGGPRLLLSGRVRCISKKLQSSPPSITPTPTFFQAAMGDASEPNIQASCTQDPDATSTSPNNQTSSGLPIPAGDQTCPVFLAGTLLLGTAQPQLRALDLRSSWNCKQPYTPTGVRNTCRACETLASCELFSPPGLQGHSAVPTCCG